MNWQDILPDYGLVIVLGRKQHGKSALGYHIMELRHELKGARGLVLGPGPDAQRLFPDWITVGELEDIPGMVGATILSDEAAVGGLHAKRSSGRVAVQVDEEITSFLGQRSQLWVVCYHHSAKTSLDLLREADILAFKRPSRMHVQFARGEMRQWVAQARVALDGKGKETSLVFYKDLEEIVLMDNPLPSFWSDEVRVASSQRLSAESTTELAAPQDEPCVHCGALTPQRCSGCGRAVCPDHTHRLGNLEIPSR